MGKNSDGRNKNFLQSIPIFSSQTEFYIIRKYFELVTIITEKLQDNLG